MSLTVKYLDIPEGAREVTQYYGDKGQPFSDPWKLFGAAIDKAYATLEPGSWSLDGTREIMPDAPLQMGWWSKEKTNDFGRFFDPPMVSISFFAPFTASGITFKFWPSTEEWCNEIELTWYSGTKKLDQMTAYPDSADWYLSRTVESFDKVEIRLLGTNKPGYFAKIQQIQIGRVIVFDRNDLTKVQLINEVDPSLCVLSADSLMIEVVDRYDQNLVPQENQRMEVYRDSEMLAAHYIVDSSRSGRRHYTFTCQSAIGLLNDEYLGGLFDAVPVTEILDDVLDGRSYQLDSSFQSATVTGYLPVCTRREALQQIAFAIGAMVTTQMSDQIMLIPVPTKKTSDFTDGKIFDGGKVETKQRIYKMEIVAHSYKQSNEVVTLLINKELEEDDQLFTFYEPHYDYEIEGGQIVDSGINWVKIRASGPVTLHAKTYVHNQAVYTKKNPQATLAERGNVVRVDAATLIHKGNVKQAMERIYKAKTLRQTLTHEAVISGEKAGDMVTSLSPWGRQLRGYIVSMESTLTQSGHTANVEIMGEMI